MGTRKHFRPDRPPTQMDWARLAMAIDGEGSIVIDRVEAKTDPRWKPHWNAHYSVTALVTNSDPRLVLWCKNIFGGFITNARGRKIRPTSKRALFQWHAISSDAKWVITNCLPYFILKREQAEIALAMFETFPKRKYGKKGVPADVIAHRDALRAELKGLKNTVPSLEEVIQ